jgi:hypothetical protein
MCKLIRDRHGSSSDGKFFSCIAVHLLKYFFIILETMPKRRSPDAVPIAKAPGNQAAIAKKWWGQKNKTVTVMFQENKSLVEEREGLKEEINKLRPEAAELENERARLDLVNVSLKEEMHNIRRQLDEIKQQKERLISENAALNAFNDSLVEDNSELQESLLDAEYMECSNVISNAVEPYGGFAKIADKARCILAVGAAIVALSGVLMKKTHNIT